MPRESPAPLAPGFAVRERMMTVRELLAGTGPIALKRSRTGAVLAASAAALAASALLNAYLARRAEREHPPAGRGRPLVGHERRPGARAGRAGRGARAGAGVGLLRADAAGRRAAGGTRGRASARRRAAPHGLAAARRRAHAAGGQGDVRAAAGAGALQGGLPAVDDATSTPYPELRQIIWEGLGIID